MNTSVGSIQLTISCKQLHKSDITSESDPFVVVSIANSSTSTIIKELGKTETIKNEASPIFLTKIECPNTLPPNQVLRFDVYDHDTFTPNDMIGQAIFHLETLKSSRDSGCTANLGIKGGIITIRCFNPNSVFSNGSMNNLPTNSPATPIQIPQLNLKFRGSNIKKMDFLGLVKSDPYFVLKQDSKLLYKSEYIASTKEPNWLEFQINTNLLNLSTKVNCSVYDKDDFTRDDHIGSTSFVPNEILNNRSAAKDFILYDPRGKNNGLLHIDHASIFRPTDNFAGQAGVQRNGPSSNSVSSIMPIAGTDDY